MQNAGGLTTLTFWTASRPIDDELRATARQLPYRSLCPRPASLSSAVPRRSGGKPPTHISVLPSPTDRQSRPQQYLLAQLILNVQESIEQNLLRLARIGLDEQHPAVAEPDVRHLQPAPTPGMLTGAP